MLPINCHTTCSHQQDSEPVFGFISQPIQVPRMSVRFEKRHEYRDNARMEEAEDEFECNKMLLAKLAVDLPSLA